MVGLVTHRKVFVLCGDSEVRPSHRCMVVSPRFFVRGRLYKYQTGYRDVDVITGLFVRRGLSVRGLDGLSERGDRVWTLSRGTRRGSFTTRVGLAVRYTGIGSGFFVGVLGGDHPYGGPVVSSGHERDIRMLCRDTQWGTVFMVVRTVRRHVGIVSGLFVRTPDVDRLYGCPVHSSTRGYRTRSLCRGSLKSLSGGRLCVGTSVRNPGSS